MNKPLLRFVVVTVFPESLSMLSQFGITSRAHKDQIWSLQPLDLRQFSTNRHRRVDDRPYGGGPGMVMQPDPLKAAVISAKSHLNNQDALVIYMSPQGLQLSQTLLTSDSRLSPAQRDFILICGRYEGVDERFLEKYVDLEISLGDYVLSGGELPALALMDAMVRLLPGVCGHQDSALNDSFSESMLDFAQYTRPESFDGQKVPSVLTGGDHKAIKVWREANALERTRERRSDLLD